MAKIKQLGFFPKGNPFLKLFKDLQFFLSDKKIGLGLKISFFTLIIIFITSLILLTKLPPQLPLLYSRPWGKDQLVGKAMLPILSLGSILIILINLRLASLFSKKELFLSRILIWTAIILSLLFSITLIRIIFIVL
ncbi:hypothetical protein COT75_02150 [Candidatus Beckwithbacteria bacterium CG10_big_fil_rev_8_21_14_0_10_34_10]|uniref:DUF1648 domain-containing protein n=1 Tax=Candidatus Beckwithbacteria bacterium CG10_big_fil_rev_8_21_14_0_10_34_10 TaxID=1974495 RepID=A0A2H0W9P9_9BACT|nr:MAG: hypothetical protein COT75_02150 [Candidatus Beckwithbacteria bacterium CG10_big_fil_rev_8_21_14_0_10_34_10]